MLTGIQIRLKKNYSVEMYLHKIYLLFVPSLPINSFIINKTNLHHVTIFLYEKSYIRMTTTSVTKPGKIRLIKFKLPGNIRCSGHN